MQLLNSLGQESFEDNVPRLMQMDEEFEVGDESSPSLVRFIGLQTDLQDDMHVAKSINDTDGVLQLCNSFASNNGRIIRGSIPWVRKTSIRKINLFQNDSKKNKELEDVTASFL